MGTAASKYLVEKYRRLLPASTVEQVQQEIENGNIDVKDIAGWTLLHVAAAAGDTSVCEELILSGASVSSVTNDGKTPLHLSLLNHHTDTAKVLIEAQMRESQTLDLPAAEPYYSDGEADQISIENESIPDAELLDPDSAEYYPIYGRPASSPAAPIQQGLPPRRAELSPEKNALLSSSPLVDDFHMLTIGTSTDDLGLVYPDEAKAEAVENVENAPTGQDGYIGGWFGPLWSYWSKKQQPDKADSEFDRIARELNELKQQFTNLNGVYRDMEEEVRSYKSLLSSQMSQSIMFAPMPPAQQQQHVPIIQPRVQEAPVQVSLAEEPPAGPPLPPPPPPPGPPPPLNASTASPSRVKVSSAPRAKTDEERQKELLQIIADSDLPRANHVKAMENYMNVFRTEIKKMDLLDKLITNYARLIQVCAATPRAAVSRMAQWEKNFFRKLNANELSRERKAQEWYITKLASKEEIQTQIDLAMKKVLKIRQEEAAKELKRQQSSKMNNVVAELKEMLQSRVLDEETASGGANNLPQDIDVLNPADLALSGSDLN